VGNRGYALENETESMLLGLTGQTRDVPMHQRCHRIPTSGAHRGMKGDVVTVNIGFLPKELCFECKRRKQRTKGEGVIFRLPEAWLFKNVKEAEDQGCKPVFLGAFTNARDYRKFVVLRPDEMAFLGVLWAIRPSIPGALNIEGTISASPKGIFTLVKSEIDVPWREHPDAFVGWNLVGRGKWVAIQYEKFVGLLQRRKEGKGEY